MLDGGVFRGQTEGVPANGMQDVETLHRHEAGQRVADGIVAHVAHVNVAGRIRQHFQHVVFGPPGLGLGVKQLLLRPALLPLGFNILRIVVWVHRFNSEF